MIFRNRESVSAGNAGQPRAAGACFFRRRMARAPLLLCPLLLWAGECLANPRAVPLKVVCTTGMVSDLVRNIGGDRVEVTTLIGEGVDPHLFKPTRDDVGKLLKADMIFFSGLLLEGRMTETFEKIRQRGKPVVAVTDGLEPGVVIRDGGHIDPHVWMDPGAWAGCVEPVRKALEKADQAGTADFARRAADYKKALADLDRYVKNILLSIPADQRVLITAHDAFQYLARATGITVLGIQGLSTESEAGVSDINRLVDEVVTRKIPAIFVETSVSDKNVRAVMEGAAARGHALRPGGSLYSDAMGAGGTYEGSYIGMIDHNATTIARALGGEAPENGMSGKL